MTRRWHAVLIGLAALGWQGCGSSDQPGSPVSMDEIAAALDQAPARASADGAPREEPAAATSPARSDPALPSRRGFALHDLSNELAYVMVKADAAKVAEAVATQLNGQVITDAMGKSADFEDAGAIVYQLAGHPWSIYATWVNEQFATRVSSLSKELNVDVLTFANSDFSGWSFVELYRGGEEVEAIHWGLDYTDEGLAGPDLSQWDTHTKITTDHGDGITLTDQFIFRSKLRKVTEQDLRKGEAFVDWLYKEHDAYLPDAPDMPWVGENGIESPLGPAAFAGVHVVQVAVE